MAAADVQAPPPEPAPALPGYVLDPDSVLKDTNVKWRYGRAPDYSKTRIVFKETKKMNHTAGSLPDLVQNLVKNWEVEASFKPDLNDWKTIDKPNYSFAINGGPPQTAEHMLKVGTYNAIIAPNEYYSPVNSDFSSSHKTFKRMMPTFAWEVLEVYSGPPQVAFRWRHWGTMKNDYVGFNDKGDKVTAKAHGGAIDIEGVTVAKVNDKLQLQSVETWFDPMEMFRQIAPNGVVNKLAVPKKVDGTVDHAAPEADFDHQAKSASGSPKVAPAVVGAAAENCPFMQANRLVANLASSPLPPGHPSVPEGHPPVSDASAPAAAPTASEPAAAPAAEAKTSIYSSSVTGNEEADPNRTKTEDNSNVPVTQVDRTLDLPASEVHPHSHAMEDVVQPGPGDAIVVPAGNAETVETHAEMSSSKERPELLNKE